MSKVNLVARVTLTVDVVSEREPDLMSLPGGARRSHGDGPQ